ncbi:hypothetical protein Hypma_008330 [Hypsizygus marmoreus]|uniref:BED-type domain-containing protein n=1 Tax=Hypsizygus marmoreus TaxID=39966 RepID=A0A369JYL6_HYPMA|nr:hypothetical protein Hypma_008330 [Hypsizygus marmoreus]
MKVGPGEPTVRRHIMIACPTPHPIPRSSNHLPFYTCPIMLPYHYPQPPMRHSESVMHHHPPPHPRLAHDQPTPASPANGHVRTSWTSKPVDSHIEADEWASEVTPTSVRCRGCKKTIRLDGRSLYYRGLWDKHRSICREIRRLKRGLAAKPLERAGAQKNGHGKVDIREQGFKRTSSDGITVATKPLLPVLPNLERKPYPLLSGPGIPPVHHCERDLSYRPTAIGGFPCDHDRTRWGPATPLHQVTRRLAQERSTNAFKSEDIDMYGAMSYKSSTTEFDFLQAAQCLISLKLQR